MNKLKSTIKEINWSPIYAVLEYTIAVYAVLTGVLNLLNLAGVIAFERWMMQPSFFGASLLIFLLLQNSLAGANCEDMRVSKLRPYATGLLAAGVISTGNTPLILLLFLELGYILLTGYGRKFDLKSGTLAALVACVSIELYCVAGLMNKEMAFAEGSFMNSLWPDVLFVLVAIVYCIVNKDEETVEESAADAIENVEAADGESTKEKKEPKFGKIKELRNTCYTWLNTNARVMSRYIGGGLCVLSLGLFLFYFSGTFAGANIIAASEEEVYLLQNCENTSLVLTMTEGEEEDTFSIKFEEYTGANNQKLQIYDRGDNLYQLVFVENEYALEVKLNEETGAYVLGVGPMSDSFEQCWVKQAFIPEQQMYKFMCAYYVPLSYPILGEDGAIPQLVVQADTGGYEFFTQERTVTDEFVTKMVCKHGEEFAPTLLFESMIDRLGVWSVIIFIFIVLLFCAVIYARRLVGDKPAVLCALMLAFLLAYASMWAAVLFILVFGVLCIIGYLRRYAKQKPGAVKQYNEQLSDMVKGEMQEALDKMEKTLQAMRDNLNAK